MLITQCLVTEASFHPEQQGLENVTAETSVSLRGHLLKAWLPACLPALILKREQSSWEKGSSPEVWS